MAGGRDPILHAGDTAVAFMVSGARGAVHVYAGDGDVGVLVEDHSDL